MDLDQKVEELKDKVIHNVQEHFAKYILEDYYQANFEGIDYTIEPEDWYYHWLDLRFNADKLKIEIIASNLSQKQRDSLLIDLIKCQVVIDQNILDLIKSIEHFPDNQLNIDLGLEEPKSNNKCFQLKEGINPEILEFAHSILYQHNFIKENLAEFLKHFDDEFQFKIKWLSSLKDLCIAVRLMGDSFLALNQNFKEIILENFQTRNKPINSKSLDTTWSTTSQYSISPTHPLYGISQINNLK